MDGGYWSLLYVAFGGTLMVTTPFFEEMLSERGFFVLLPVKVGSRIRGRYLFGVVYLLLCCIFGAMISGGIFLYKNIVPEDFIQVSILICCTVIVCNDIQFLIFSFLNIKNAQVLSIIRMMIPFLIFFVGNWIMETVSIEQTEVINIVSKLYNFFVENITVATCLMILISMVITLLSCEISVWHETRKE